MHSNTSCFVSVFYLLTDSENMLKLKGKNARDIYSSRFGTDGCLRSSLEVLKTIVQIWELDVIYSVSLDF